MPAQTQNQNVSVHVGPQSATALAAALGGQAAAANLPRSYGGHEGGFGTAPMQYAPYPDSAPLVLHGGIDYSRYTPPEEEMPGPVYTPKGSNYLPYNNGDFSTQQGGPVGPYFSKDANPAIAHFGPTDDGQPTYYSTDVTGQILPPGYQSPREAPTQQQGSGWVDDPNVMGYRSDGTPYTSGYTDEYGYYTAPIGQTVDYSGGE